MTSLFEASGQELVIWRLAVAVSAAVLGAFTAVSFRKISHLGLCLLISFAAGSLLAVSLLHILPESFHILGPVGAGLSALSGYLLFFLLTRFVFHVCPACAATHTEVNFKALTIAMLVALSVHCFMDGLAIISGEHSGHRTGLAILLAVTYHKFPEGMALTLVALGSGMSRSKAFWITVLLEAITTVAGGTAGLLFPFKEHAAWAGYVMGHIGGGFIFLVLHALLSEVVKHHPRFTILSALAGAFSIYCVQLWVR